MSFTTLEQLKTIGRELAMGGSSQGSSREFLELVKAIGEAKSKAEEERIVLAEMESLKRRIQEPDVPRKKMKEYIIRLVYVEMLGHDASFGYIHAVKMTHDDNLLLKRSGYLAVTLFLHEDHDLIILIVNTIQKDLKSDNYLVVCAALTAVCRLINEETVPAVLPQIVDLLNHQKELVRKKAVMALHRFFQRSPSTVSHLYPAFQEGLCDKDPSVMSAVLCALYDIIQVNMKPFKHLVASLVSILKQAVEHRLPKSYDYHRTPAPFVQIKLLKILALLGTGDKAASENMFNVLGDILKRSDSSSNIGNAILYECVRTLTSIYANPRLLQNSAEITAKFLKSDSHNLKYMGIDALGRLIKVTPECAEDHQLAVIDCLEDPDDTLKRKTLDLLYKMTKANNVEVIVERMVGYIKNISDDHYKTEISSRIIELAERYAPSNQWFIQTMNQVFEIAGDLVAPKVAHDLMRLIAEGAGEEEDEDADNHLRSSAVQAYLQILKEPKLPSILLQVISWVLGEYGTADGSYSAEFIIGQLCDIVAMRPGDDRLKGYVMSAITKICAFEKAAGRTVELIPECLLLVEGLSTSHSTDLQQRVYEFHAVLKLDRNTIASVLPMDGSCEDIEVDKDLSLLNGFVESALANGSRPYMSDNERQGMGAMTTLASTNDSSGTASLRFQPYEKPTVPEPSALVTSSHFTQDPMDQDHRYSGALSVSVSSRAPESGSSSSDATRLKLEGVQKKWGRPTYTPEPDVPKPTASVINISDSIKVSNAAAKETSRASRYTEPKPEISSEKKKLAASLFGAKSGDNKSKPITAARHQNGTTKKAPAKAPAPAAAPAGDLLDLSDSLPQIVSPDPGDQLADLISVDSGVSAAATTTTSSTSLIEQVLDAGKVAKKGPSPQASLQKDAVSRQVGVTPSGGTNPDLFKDLFG